MVLNGATYYNKNLNAEQNLIEKCLHNDRRAQKELYCMYCDAMYSTIFRMLDNEDDANDVLQDAFIEVFRNISSFRFESSLGAWIKTIVIRTAIRFAQKRVVMEVIDNENPVHDIVLEIPDYIDGELLEKSILSLPEYYRTVFLLTEVEGYAHAEVAQMLNINENTSKSRLLRAKKLLQKTLNSIDK